MLDPPEKTCCFRIGTPFRWSLGSCHPTWILLRLRCQRLVRADTLGCSRFFLVRHEESHPVRLDRLRQIFVYPVEIEPQWGFSRIQPGEGEQIVGDILLHGKHLAADRAGLKADSARWTRKVQLYGVSGDTEKHEPGPNVCFDDLRVQKDVGSFQDEARCIRGQDEARCIRGTTRSSRGEPRGGPDVHAHGPGVLAGTVPKPKCILIVEAHPGQVQGRHCRACDPQGKVLRWEGNLNHLNHLAADVERDDEGIIPTSAVVVAEAERLRPDLSAGGDPEKSQGVLDNL